jgi:hypothetical protein
MTEIVGTTKLELLFRRAAGLDLDKDDLKRLSDFVNQKVYDLLLIGQAVAKANNRDMIERGICRFRKGCRSAWPRAGRLKSGWPTSPSWKSSPPYP